MALMMSSMREFFPSEEARKAEYQKIVEENRPLVEQRIKNYNEQCKDIPLVGEFFINLKGEFKRFTHCWGDCIQVGASETNSGFYLNDSGRCSYSGSLDPSIPHENFQLTDEVKMGNVWTFDRNYAQAHNGYYYQIPFRVWKLVK
jgi:hypothetical protein